jgi:trigger factor
MQDSCKRTLEVTVPLLEVEDEREKVVREVAKKVSIPGFRPGKVPLGVVKSKFAEAVRSDLLDMLLPKAFTKKANEEGHKVVGTPNVIEIKFEPNEPLWFKAEFEVAPEYDVTNYDNVEVEYAEPLVTDEDVQKELDSIQESKADYVNLDARPLQTGDFAVVSLKSLEGIDPAMEQDDLQIELGSENTVAGFSENLAGMSPGETKEFTLTYPEDYASERLAGKTVKFHVEVKGLRKKELPEINDELAKDVGDFQTLDELKERIRTNLFGNRQYEAQRTAKEKIVDKLVESHQFPIPDAYLDRQIQSNVERQFRSLASQGIDPSQLKLDWSKIRDAQAERAAKEVRSALIVDKVAEKEAIEVTQEEIDQQLNLIAREEKKPVAAMRAQMEKDGSLQRLAGSIRTEKALQLLFDRSSKVAPSA